MWDDNLLEKDQNLELTVNIIKHNDTLRPNYKDIEFKLYKSNKNILGLLNKIKWRYLKEEKKAKI